MGGKRMGEKMSSWFYKIDLQVKYCLVIVWVCDRCNVTCCYI